MTEQTVQEPVTQVLAVPVVESLARGEIDIQIRTAKSFPRKVPECQRRAIELATLDEETAAACLYALPRAGKKIEGGSIRLAEILASAWTNLRIGSRVIDDADPKHVTSQAVCHDLETNVSYTVEKKRRITDKNGRRFNDDMIVTTANAAVSIAMRDAIFRAVPKAYWKTVQDAAKRVVVGDATTLNERRHKALDAFAKMGVFPDRLLAAIERDSIEEITSDDLAELLGVFQAIRDGEVSVDAAFPEPVVEGENARPQTPLAKAKAAAKAAQEACVHSAVASATATKQDQGGAVSETSPLSASESTPTGADPDPKPTDPGDAMFDPAGYDAIRKKFAALPESASERIRENFGFKLLTDIKKWTRRDVDALVQAIDEAEG